jgi:preprotein translocase subunit SecA
LAAPFKINFKNNLIFLQQQVKISYDLNETEIESIKEGLMKELGRIFVLQQIDLSWKEHLQRMSLLRDCIRWRIYGQKNPLTEYKKEAFDLFINMLIQIRQRGVYFVLRSKILVE